jgi:hypothetical protein
MEFNNVRMVGPLNVEQLDTLPEFIQNRDQSRFVWLTDGTLWYGDVDKWVKVSIKDYGYHNDLTGRDEPDCHPIHSITDLPEEITRIDNRITYLHRNDFKWLEINTDYQLSKYRGYFTDTTNNTIDLLLPPVSASEIGDTIKIVDHKRTFGKNNVTILTNGSLIEGSTDDVVISLEDSTTVLTYSDDSYGWDCITYRNTLNFETDIIDSDTDIIPNVSYLIDTRNGPITLTVPENPNDLDTIQLKDLFDTNKDNPITIQEPNGDVVSVIDDNCNDGILVFNANDDIWVFNTECNRLKDDISIYVAPNKDDLSPDGIAVGSDDIGNGTIDKPFFSIKRAVEYIEQNFYIIPSNVNINIIGLPGIYEYDDTHIVKTNSNVMKNVNILFPSKDDDNYHQTSVKVDSVNVDHYNTYDIVSFNVEDIGDGFYEIKPNDFVKISIDTNLSSTPEGSVWAGYYKVYSVDKQNKRISIYFERYSPYRLTPNGYVFPGETHINSQIILTKLTTHINVNGDPQGTPTFMSFYNGLNTLHINIACHFKSMYNGIYINNHVIRDVVCNVSYFRSGLQVENAVLFFSDNNEYEYSSTFTSNNIGFECMRSRITFNRYHFINNQYGMVLYHVQRIDFSETGSTIVNSYYAGIECFYSELQLLHTPEIDVLNIFHCYVGVSLTNYSIIKSYGINISNCVYGIIASDTSTIRPISIGAYENPPQKYGKLYDNTRSGILVKNNSTAEIIYLDIYNNDFAGVEILDDSTATTLTFINCEKRSLIHDNNIGVFIYKNGNLLLEQSEMYNNTTNIECYSNSSFEIISSTIKDATDVGIKCLESSKGYIMDTTITNNTNQDILTSENSNILLKNSVFDVITPLPDENPVYTGWLAGSYNVELNCEKSDGTLWGDTEDNE